jgi:hypothetical protein
MRCLWFSLVTGLLLTPLFSGNASAQTRDRSEQGNEQLDQLDERDTARQRETEDARSRVSSEQSNTAEQRAAESGVRDRQNAQGTQVVERQREGRRGAMWRYKRHNGEWWYWTPNNAWMYWRNGQWNRYNPDSFRRIVRDDPVYVDRYQDGYYYYPRQRYSTGYRGVYDDGYYRYGDPYYGGYYYGRPGYGNPYWRDPGYRRGANIGGAIGGALGGSRGAGIGSAIGGEIGRD